MKKNIGVIGAGQMGLGIAQVFATHGFPVLLNDANPQVLAQARDKLAAALQKIVFKNQMTDAQAQEILSRITYGEDFTNCDLVIEAVIESYAIKADIFSKLENLVSPDCIIATNTSSISINKLAANLRAPHRFVGMHFMNPVPVMPLVELIKSDATSDETLADIIQMIMDINKQYVMVQDQPGFIVNRLLIPLINEAVILFEAGTASAADIDKALILGANMPMGPLRLADFIGLDTCLAIMEVLHCDLKSDKYQPSPLLVQYVKAGKVGKKCGRGFYNY